MKRKVVSQILVTTLVLALLLVSVPAVADSGLTSGFAKIKDWDETHEAFSFSSGQVAWGSGDFFISPRGIHVFESPGIIDMGLVYLDDVGEAPATGYVEMAAPVDGHTYVVRSNGKYGKFYLEETYDWLTPIQYGISWVYQTNGTRSLGSSASTGQTVTSGQTGTVADTGCTYEQYITAYNKLTSLMSQGKGDTPEAQAAYAEYAKVKACYESGSTGTGQSSTSTSTSTSTSSGTYTIPTTTTPPAIPPTSTSTASTPVTLHLTCENKDNEERGCGPFYGTHTYLFGSLYVTSVVVRFDTGRKFDCRSAVSLQVYRNGAWQTIETINAVSSSGNSEFAPLEVQVPVNDTIAGFRISDGCVCCIDFSEITIYGSQSTPQSSTTTTTSSSQTSPAAGQTFSYPPSKWVPAQDGQSAVSLGQDQICISSMKPGGAMAYTKRDYDITSDYTVEFDYMVGTDDNHWIIVYSDGYLFLIIDWGTQLSHCQTGRLPLHLEVNRWYKIRMDAYPGQGKYDVYADGVKLGTAVNLHVGFNHKLERGNLLTWLDKIYPAWDCIYLGDIDNEYFMAGRYNRGIACWKNITVRQSAGTTTSTITPVTEDPQKPGLDPSQIVSPPTTSTATTTTSTTSIPAGTALIAESRTVMTGGTVQVPIYFQDAQNIGSLGFTLSYDPAVVQVVKVSKGSLLSSATFTSSDQSGSIIFGFASPQAISGNGSAAVVEFKALGSAGSSSSLTLSEILATSYYGSSLAVSPVNGLLTIGQNQPGDADGDGKLSVLDALIALKMYVKTLPLDLIADINQDGKVTPEDARLIMQKAKP